MITQSGVARAGLWAIVIGQKEFALDAMQALCQPLMVLLSEGCSIIFFCPVVRRVTVKQSVGPIINPYQTFKIQMFNHDPIQTILYSREFGQHIFEAFFAVAKVWWSLPKLIFIR